MKNTITILALCLIGTLSFAQQAPAIQWQKCLGGTGYEKASNIATTNDGGYIIVGTTEESNNGDVTNNHGFSDGWVVKISNIGILEWQKTLGGVFDDTLYSVQQTSDGGYIVLGITTSSDLNLSGLNADGDYFVVKLSSLGVIEWQNAYGGSNNEIGIDIYQTTDSGYILAGETYSNNGEVTGNHGSYDAWIVKISNSGNLEWQKCFGGTANDNVIDIQQTSDNGYILAGTTGSNDGNVMGNHGLNDAWLVKLSSSGNLEWQKALGGADNDYAYKVQQTTDGDYILAGSTKSIDNDVLGNHGATDYWLVKLSNSGAIVWQKVMGGNLDDWAYDVKETTEGNFIVVGYTNSNDGDVTGNQGASDAWIIKLSNSGTILWQKTMGGSKIENSHSFQQTTDGGYILVGTTGSIDGDVSGNHSIYTDIWVVKLGPELASTTFNNQALTLYPNPTNGLLQLQTPNNTSFNKIIITDSTGKIVLEQTQNTTQVDVEKLASGLYIIKAFSGEEVFVNKFVKE